MESQRAGSIYVDIFQAHCRTGPVVTRGCESRQVRLYQPQSGSPPEIPPGTVRVTKPRWISAASGATRFITSSTRSGLVTSTSVRTGQTGGGSSPRPAAKKTAGLTSRPEVGIRHGPPAPGWSVKAGASSTPGTAGFDPGCWTPRAHAEGKDLTLDVLASTRLLTSSRPTPRLDVILTAKASSSRSRNRTVVARRKKARTCSYRVRVNASPDKKRRGSGSFYLGASSDPERQRHGRPGRTCRRPRSIGEMDKSHPEDRPEQRRSSGPGETG